MSSGFTSLPQDAATGSQGDHHVNCPHCGEGFDLNEAMQLQHQEAIEFRVRDAVSDRVLELDALQARVKKQEASIASDVSSQVAQRLKAESVDMRKAWEEEQSAKEQVQADEMAKLRKKAKEGNALKAELAKLKAGQELAMDDARTSWESAAAEAHAADLREQKQKLEAASRLQKEEYDRRLSSMKESLAEAERKASLGSQQEQGEVQEVVLEDVLRGAFPTDHVEEISKGARGADCLLRIHDPHQPTSSCSILFESKRTKAFSKAWIAKFREDIREAGADTGIIVTQAMPDGATAPVQLDGVFVCRLQDVHFVTTVVRADLLHFSSALKAQEGKEGKIKLLYNYLTGPECKQAWDNVCEQYRALKQSHDSEKRSTEQRWKREEKMLTSAMQSVTEFYWTMTEIGKGKLALPPLYPTEPDGLPEGEADGDV